MLLNSRSGKNAKQYVEKKLINRLRRFFVLFTLLVAVICYEINKGYLHYSVAIGAMMIGMMVGAAFVRRKKIYWEEETSTVIARMDNIGIWMLVIYILFAITRHFLLESWFRGNQLTAFSFSLAAGGMLGKLLSVRSQIRQILKERKII